jgi:endonuclease/exonuclease/phosphatase family metal-dependent hydrolase
VKLSAKLLRRLRKITFILLALVLVPYAFSRVASSWRCVGVHTHGDLPASTSEADTLRIACYNIAHGRGLAASNWEGGTAENRAARLDQIADLLRSLDTDVVVLNEVDFDSSWSYSVNQARYLARRAGYPFWVEQRNVDVRLLTWKWRFGNAVLSKYPITEASVIDLPAYSAVESLLAGKKRGVSCTINISGQPMRILGVHLSHRSEAVRAQSATVLTQITSSESVPTIVAGDLNSSPTGLPNSQSDPEAGNAMDILDASAQFQRRPAQAPRDRAEMTFPSAQPEVVIDWILIPKNWKFTDYRVEASTLSDHRPVLAELLLQPAQSAE